MELIQNTLSKLINLIGQEVGAPPHTVLAASEYINANYHTWIVRNGTTLWPRNSADLTTLSKVSNPGILLATLLYLFFQFNDLEI